MGKSHKKSSIKMAYSWIVSVLVFIISFLVMRLLIMLYTIRQTRLKYSGSWDPQGRGSFLNQSRFSRSIKLMIVAGSGGHTAEILKLVSHLSVSYTPRHYIVADTDIISADKIRTLERWRNLENVQHVITYIPRSREVMQSWFTTLLSSTRALFYSIIIVFRARPDLLLCNGPGTCVPLCLAAFVSTIVGMKHVTVIFVESVCRVTSMSLTGRILYLFADHIIIQWPELQRDYPLTTYMGRIV